MKKVLRVYSILLIVSFLLMSCLSHPSSENKYYKGLKGIEVSYLKGIID